MIGSLGDDLYKDKIIKELEEFGVKLHVVVFAFIKKKSFLLLK